jgi:hypothetical protein
VNANAAFVKIDPCLMFTAWRCLAGSVAMLRGRNPDVLTCIANLSHDEVFTPPEFANRMLDTVAEA